MAKSQNGPCTEVASGGVGESGASSQVTHQVTAKISKLMVLRRTESSLCPNTGAAAILVVNGTVEAAGVITGSGSSIQAEAGPGDWVIGIVHTFPLFNEISCIRLGELGYRLDECDLVTATAAASTRSDATLSCEDRETRDWYAWNNLMPPKPDDFHVVGEVLVPNPGVDVFLVPIRDGKDGKGKGTGKSKGGGKIRLELVLVQRSGIWPQVLTWKSARYDKVLTGPGPKTVEITCNGKVIETVPVEEVH